MAYEYLFFVLPLTVFASDSANVNTSGNITSVKKYSLTAEGVAPSGSYTLTSYGYSSDGWGDKLTSFNGQSITYDSIGNPLTYYNGNAYSFTWQGRQLVGATKGNKTMSFEYNADGIRTSKTVNGVETKYYLNGSQIVAEVNPNYSIMYIYDAEGSPIGMQYRASSYAENVFDYYFFEKNLQGDIVALYGSNGTKYVEYSYDAWGNFTTTYYNGGASTGAAKNPFTYRGYYYDADLNLYYLNSRYYDQNTRRFVNADSYVSTGQGILGNNMYAYCGNNPVTRTDKTGEGWYEFWDGVGDFFSDAADAVCDFVDDAWDSFCVLSEAFFTSIEIEVGVGFGLDINLLDNLTAGFSRDTFVGFDEGELITGNTITAELSFLDSEIGVGDTYKHVVERNGNRVSSSGKPYHGPFDMMFYPDVEHGNKFSYSIFHYNSSNEFSIGLSGGIHLGIGGSFYIGFNVSEFLRKLG